MEIEEVLTYLGSFGRYQRFIFFLICFVMLPCAMVKQVNLFLGASPDHYCSLTDNQTYELDSSLKQCTIPHGYDNDTREWIWDQCRRYDLDINITNLTSVSPDCFTNEDETVTCQNWVYDRSKYDHTIVSEFNLVCDREWLLELSKIMIPIGNIFGAIVLGQVADIYGRKHTFFTSLLFTFVAGFLTTFSPNLIAHLIGQFVLGFFHSAVYIVAMVIGIEIVTMNYRPMVITMFLSFHGVGSMILCLLAYGVKSNWQRLLFTVSISWLIYFPYYWLIPESLRWLIDQRRYMKAHSVIDKISRHNNIELPPNFFSKTLPSSMDERHHPATLLSAFKRRHIAFRVFVACLVWFSIFCTSSGINIKTATLLINPYLRPLVGAAVEFPALFLTWLFVHTIGRRIVLSISMILAGMALIASSLTNQMIIVVAFAFLGKLFLSCSYAVAHLMTLEFLPTPVRGVGFGVAIASGCVGSAVSPFIQKLGVAWQPLPFVIFGGTTVVAGVLALFLPKTFNRKLPETFEEGVAMKRSDSKTKNEIKEAEFSDRIGDEEGVNL
ncbi:organic cation transporter protein-like [Glandiceps talaboti]